MKFSPVLALSAATVVYGQSVGELPSCAVNCFLGPLQSDGCKSLSDFECHCSDPTLLPKVLPCVRSKCPAAVHQEVEDKTVALCKQHGVDLSTYGTGNSSLPSSTVETVISTSIATKSSTISTTRTAAPVTDPSSEEDGASNVPITGVAIGGVVGGVVAGMIIAILAYMLFKRRRRAQQRRRDVAAMGSRDFGGGNGSDPTGYNSGRGGVPFNADSYTYGSPQTSSQPISQLDGSPVFNNGPRTSRITNNPINHIAELALSPARSELASQPTTTTTARTPPSPLSRFLPSPKPGIVLSTATTDDGRGNDSDNRAVRPSGTGRHVMSWSQYDDGIGDGHNAHALGVDEMGKGALSGRTKLEERSRLLSASASDPEKPGLPRRTITARDLPIAGD